MQNAIRQTRQIRQIGKKAVVQYISADAKALADGFELDLFSTFLSRKYAYHRCIGPRRYVKIRRV